MVRFTLAASLTSALLVVPAAARASTVSEVQTPGASYITEQFRAANGEANDLTVTRDLLFTDDGAFLSPGKGCGIVGGGVQCTTFPVGLVDVQLKDGNDQASVIGYPDAQTANVSGGGGNDTVFAVAGGNTTVTGDAGDDSVSAESDILATVDGGSGNDVVSVDPYIATGRATGGSGDDQLYFDPRGFNASTYTMDGGTGDDIVVASPDATSGSSMTGGDGDDVLAVSGAGVGAGHGVTVTGGNGNDTIIGGPFGDTVDGGPGRDVIDVAGGGADTVTCGDGVDVVRYDSSDTIASDCEVKLTQ